jgi:hypothetical protein
MVTQSQKPFCVLEFHSTKSVTTVQRGFQRKFRKTPPRANLIQESNNRFQDIGYRCPDQPPPPPLDFFYWGYIKDEVYVLPLPAALETLKERIQNAVGNIHCELLESVWPETKYFFDVRTLNSSGVITKTHEVLLPVV